MNFSSRTRRKWVPHYVWLPRECPRCNSIKFKTEELRSFDRLLAMFALRPVRCMFCWRRYYWFRLRDPVGP
jgi:hypothetical protein